MKKNYLLTLSKSFKWLFSAITVLITLSLNAQTIGDFQTRSVTTDSFSSPMSWTATTTWQIYTADGWADTTSYPGGPGTLSTATVTILKDSYVSITSSSTGVSYSFGILNVYGGLILKNSAGSTGGSDQNITFSTTPKVNIYADTTQTTGYPAYGNGTILWDGKIRLTLSSSNAVVNVSNAHYDQTPYPKTGLQASNCTNNNELYIGTTSYGVCTGGGNASFLFSQINSSGGTIEAEPKVTPTTVCQNETVSLEGGFSGAVGTTPTYTWSSRKPDGTVNNIKYNLPTTDANYFKNPGIQNPLTMVGTYTFTLEVSTTYNGNNYKNAQTINVTVNPRPAITNMTATQCSGQTFTVSPTNGTNGVVPSGTTYTWSSPVVTGGITGGTAGSGSSIVGSLLNTTGSPQTATYTVTPTSSAGCTGNTFTVTVTVNASSLTGPSTLTVGQTATYVGAPTPGTYTSSNPTVATISSSGLVTALAEGTTVIRFTNTATGCYETITLNVGTICTKLPTAATVTNPALPTKFGITALSRANSGSNNWPGVRKGAYLVMEAKVNGFVLPRLTKAQIDAIDTGDLVKGMAVYNMDSKCFYVYNGTSWQCYKTQGCSN